MTESTKSARVAQAQERHDHHVEPSEGYAATPALGDRLACAHIQQLDRFESHPPAASDIEVRINANELPEATGPYVLDLSGSHRYPGPITAQLEEAYASYAGVSRDRVIATRGADEGLALIVRAFSRTGTDAIAHCPPTYGLYHAIARTHDVRAYAASLTSSYGLDHAALAGAPTNTKVVLLCNPNNPTGNLFTVEEIARVAATFEDRALVVVDEAYIEFCPESSVVPLLESLENLVVVRTLSKAFGLAGIHVGFTIAHPKIVEALRRIMLPYPIADPCAQIALQALAEDGIGRMRATTQAIIATRDRFADELRGIDGVTQVLPSHTNFVLARFQDRTQAWNELVTSGILARQPEQDGLGSHIRFSIGTGVEMDRVLQALRPRRRPLLDDLADNAGRE